MKRIRIILFSTIVLIFTTSCDLLGSLEDLLGGDNSALITAIGTAQSLLTSKNVGDNPGNVPQLAHDAFAAAIATAQGVADDDSARQTQFDEAVTDLEIARLYFVASVIPGGIDDSALITGIASANALNNETSVGSEEGQVPQSAKDTFTAAITTAEGVASNDGATQAEIDEAVTALGTASAIFVNAVITEDIEYYVFSDANTPDFPWDDNGTLGTYYGGMDREPIITESVSTHPIDGGIMNECVFDARGGWSGYYIGFYDTSTAPYEAQAENFSEYDYISLSLKFEDCTSVFLKVSDMDFNPDYADYDGLSTDDIASIPGAIITDLGDGWKEYKIPLTVFKSLGNKSQVNNMLVLGSPDSSGTVYMDNLYFTDDTSIAKDPITFNIFRDSKSVNFGWGFPDFGLLGVFNGDGDGNPTLSTITTSTHPDGDDALSCEFTRGGGYSGYFFGFWDQSSTWVPKPKDFTGFNYLVVSLKFKDCTSVYFKGADSNYDTADGYDGISTDDVAAAPGATVTDMGNGWTQYKVPLAEFADSITDLSTMLDIFVLCNPDTSGTVYMDDLYYSE